jgi:ABC-type dipeptide/oligopeptide/nickel transport system permease component
VLRLLSNIKVICGEGMGKYILRRTAVAIPLILAIATIVFVMLRVALPGDPAQLLAGDRATPAPGHRAVRDLSDESGAG